MYHEAMESAMSRRKQDYWDQFDEAIDKALELKKSGHFDYKGQAWFLEQANMNPYLVKATIGYIPLSAQAMANGRYNKIMEFRSLF